MNGQSARREERRRTILVTGGTGTLGRELVARFTAVNDTAVIVLVRGQANSGASPISAAVTRLRGDVRAGTSLGLAPSERAELTSTVTDIVHCAAETTFNRPLDDARAVNVEGTKAVLELARDCRRLERVACFSTVYVAGRATGCFGEAAIGGDSRTGAVSGFNAVHHALRLLYQGLAPMVPGRANVLVDLIPVDFAADASHALFTRAFEPGRTYHLCSGAARSATLGTLLDATMVAFERHRPAWRKRSIARPALVELDTYELFARSVEEAGNQVLLQATRAVQAFAYQLAYPKVFDARHAEAALAPFGIVVPPVLDYYERVVRWCVETNWGAPS